MSPTYFQVAFNFFSGQTRPVFLGSTRFWAQFLGSNGRVGPQDPKTGPIGSGWPQIGFLFGFNPIMYLKNLICFRVGFGPQGPKSGWVKSGRPSGSKFGSGWLGSFGRTTVLQFHVSCYKTRNFVGKTSGNHRWSIQFQIRFQKFWTPLWIWANGNAISCD